MPYSTISSLASSTELSAYFTVRIICPPILKSQNSTRASLVRYLPYKLEKKKKKKLCLTPLPILTFLVWSSFSLTHWSMYSLLISLLSCQSIPVPFCICINLVQLTWSNAFCQSVQPAHNSSSLPIVFTDIISNIIASLVPFLLRNSNWSSPSTSSVCLSNLL